jgi:hypothetical protein
VEIAAQSAEADQADRTRYRFRGKDEREDYVDPAFTTLPTRLDPARHLQRTLRDSGAVDSLTGGSKRGTITALVGLLEGFCFSPCHALSKVGAVSVRSRRREGRILCPESDRERALAPPLRSSSSSSSPSDSNLHRAVIGDERSPLRDLLQHGNQEARAECRCPTCGGPLCRSELLPSRC